MSEQERLHSGLFEQFLDQFVNLVIGSHRRGFLDLFFVQNLSSRQIVHEDVQVRGFEHGLVAVCSYEVEVQFVLAQIEIVFEEI